MTSLSPAKTVVKIFAEC